MRVLLCLVVLLAGCTRRAESSPQPEAAPAALAAPVVAPLQARDRILEDLRVQKAAAEARRAEFDRVLEGRDH